MKSKKHMFDGITVEQHREIVRWARASVIERWVWRRYRTQRRQALQTKSGEHEK